MWLKNSHFCSSWQSCSFVTQQNRIVLRKLSLSHINEANKSIIFLQGTFPPHILFLDFCFIIAKTQALIFNLSCSPLGTHHNIGDRIDKFDATLHIDMNTFYPCSLAIYFYTFIWSLSRWTAGSSQGFAVLCISGTKRCGAAGNRRVCPSWEGTTLFIDWYWLQELLIIQVWYKFRLDSLHWIIN